MVNYADMEQLYGPLYEHADQRRGDHIAYIGYDGAVRSGEILWIQEPGRAVGKDGQAHHLKAQYVVQPDAIYDMGMVDFVPLGEVIQDPPLSLGPA